MYVSASLRWPTCRESRRNARIRRRYTTPSDHIDLIGRPFHLMYSEAASAMPGAARAVAAPIQRDGFAVWPTSDINQCEGRTMNEPIKRSAWGWQLLGYVVMYVGFTLLAAMLATPPDNPSTPSFVYRLGGLAGQLPGAGVWPELMDMNGKIAGNFPVPFVGGAILVLLGAGAIQVGRNIRAQRKHDAAIARDEAIRIGERERRQSRPR